MARAKNTHVWVRQPSWWLVVVAGTLCVTFVVAIVRELLNSRNVGQQVKRLQNEVATEEKRQQQLQDLIDYLHSPTFQEQEARLKLGLKKTGENVLVIPPANGVTNDGSTIVSGTVQTVPIGHPQAWWEYFFRQRASTTTS